MKTEHTMRAANLKSLNLPYINDYQVGVHESIDRAQKLVPAGWSVIADRLVSDIPAHAIRIGQVRVRQGDTEYSLYAIPNSVE